MSVTETPVAEFHSAFHQERPAYPTPPDSRLARLRLRLIREEYEEVRVELEYLAHEPHIQDAIPAMRRLLKELADLRYVVDGCAVALGMPIEAAFLEVHRSNMSKLGPDGKPIKRADGKALKGPDYRDPDMDSLIPGIIEGQLS